MDRTFELTRRDVNRLRRVLIELLDQSEADSCLVCDGAGHVLAHENVNRQDPLLISALGAGVFAATRELARILGEDEFSTVLHQGVKRSILMAAATEEILLVVMFSGENRVGLVKLYTPAAVDAIRGIFESIKSRGAEGDPSVDRNFVLKETADIFSGSQS
ncbi:MAG: roadblock/LC7 domain-containing protein [Lentisphaeria bacterium]|nr:roadblock/LC7 domain-containing protein [Lentisphaeria bacterium]